MSLCVVPGADLQGITDRDVMYLLSVKRGASPRSNRLPRRTGRIRLRLFSRTARSTRLRDSVCNDGGPRTGGLNGLTFEMVVNGGYAGTAVVTGGSLTIPAAFVPAAGAMTVVAGLNFYSLVTSMPLVPQDAEGTGQLKKSAIPKSRFRLYNSLYMKAGQFVTPNAGGNSPLTNVKMGTPGMVESPSTRLIHPHLSPLLLRLRSLRDSGRSPGRRVPEHCLGPSLAVLCHNHCP